jgi:flagellar biosynthesis protein FlhB
VGGWGGAGHCIRSMQWAMWNLSINWAFSFWQRKTKHKIWGLTSICIIQYVYSHMILVPNSHTTKSVSIKKKRVNPLQERNRCLPLQPYETQTYVATLQFLHVTVVGTCITSFHIVSHYIMLLTGSWRLIRVYTFTCDNLFWYTSKKQRTRRSQTHLYLLLFHCILYCDCRHT